MKTIFGPVISRRFGNSLGIDLSPTHKQCNFDCLYCELAPAKTVDKQEYSVKAQEIIDELVISLQEHKNIDIITITANGEPTLYPYLDNLIESIDKIKGDIKTLILTNSATLKDEAIYKTLLKFDKVKLSLDAVSAKTFKKIDRPHNDIDITDIALHVKNFSHEFTGELFIEILFVSGINDSLDEIKKLNDTLLHVNATRIDIGTIDRPPAYLVDALSYEELMAISHHFDSNLPINISSRKKVNSKASFYTKEEIINTLDKRPLSEEDIDILFNTKSKLILKKLIEDEKVVKIDRAGVFFYILRENLDRKRSSKNLTT